jgi:RNA polymerase sigma-70 factor (ECF subfamily)
VADPAGPFRDQIDSIYSREAPRLRRYLARLSGDPELAADITQELFIRLYGRGSLPDTPVPWLISVAMNLFRNAASKGSRRRRLLTPARAAALSPGPGTAPDGALARDETRRRVREALAALPERDRRLLLLSAEEYRYRDIAAAMGLNEASIGTLLARARRALRQRFEELSDAR